MSSADVPTLTVSPLITLRPVAVADAAELFAVVDANRGHLREWLPWLDWVRTVEDEAAFLAGVVDRGRAGRGAVWRIEHGGTTVGIVGFNSVEPTNRVGEIGYWLAADGQGRGTMAACVGRLVDHAFDDLALNRLTIPVAVGNGRSRRVAERAGFRAEGTLRQTEWLYDRFVDHVLYAMVRDDRTAPAAVSVR